MLVCRNLVEEMMLNEGAEQSVFIDSEGESAINDKNLRILYER